MMRVVIDQVTAGPCCWAVARLCTNKQAEAGMSRWSTHSAAAPSAQARRAQGCGKLNYEPKMCRPTRAPGNPKSVPLCGQRSPGLLLARAVASPSSPVLVLKRPTPVLLVWQEASYFDDLFFLVIARRKRMRGRAGWVVLGLAALWQQTCLAWRLPVCASSSGAPSQVRIQGSILCCESRPGGSRSCVHALFNCKDLLIPALAHSLLCLGGSSGGRLLTRAPVAAWCWRRGLPWCCWAGW